MQFYDALGLAPKLALDSETLKKHFYERSRQWHPDRFSRSSAEEQQKSLEMTSVLNDAFRTLRDPVARAEYFLEERGIKAAKHVPPELLEEVFEMNIALEELRAGDESARPQLTEARERFHHMPRRMVRPFSPSPVHLHPSQTSTWSMIRTARTISSA